MFNIEIPGSSSVLYKTSLRLIESFPYEKIRTYKLEKKYIASYRKKNVHIIPDHESVNIVSINDQDKFFSLY